jgi:hypothetical protein
MAGALGDPVWGGSGFQRTRRLGIGLYPITLEESGSFLSNTYSSQSKPCEQRCRAAFNCRDASSRCIRVLAAASIATLAIVPATSSPTVAVSVIPSPAKKGANVGSEK